MKFLNKLATTSIASSILASSLVGISNVSYASGSGNGPTQSDVTYMGNTENPKNIIFMVGDGMGPSYNTAYRHFQDDPNTKDIERSAFDDYLVGTQTSDNDDNKENITDSAAAGTALSTGERTYNGAVGVDNNKKRLETILEKAKKNGKSTGLVSTAEITDATPAAYAAHVDSRDKKNEIASQFYNEMINGQHKVDVLLGGGSKYFGKENGNLDQKFNNDGYDVVDTKQELLNTNNPQVLGLFSEKNMPLAMEAPEDDPSLAEMQTSALNRLEQNQNGFFLMVEGASIDKAGHPNDITGAMSEMESFEEAFANATAYAKSHPDTLIVATADHETGGLAMGKDGKYEWHPEPIRQMKHSGNYMTEAITKGEDVTKVINDGYGFEVSEKQIQAIQKEADKLSQLDEEKDGEKYEEQLSKLQDAIQKPINDKSNTGWTSTGHTGVDSNVYGYGPGIENFSGVTDNIDNSPIFESYLK